MQIWTHYLLNILKQLALLIFLFVLTSHLFPSCSGPKPRNNFSLSYIIPSSLALKELSWLVDLISEMFSHLSSILHFSPAISIHLFINSFRTIARVKYWTLLLKVFVNYLANMCYANMPKAKLWLTVLKGCQWSPVGNSGFLSKHNDFSRKWLYIALLLPFLSLCCRCPIQVLLRFKVHTIKCRSGTIFREYYVLSWFCAVHCLQYLACSRPPSPISLHYNPIPPSKHISKAKLSMRSYLHAFYMLFFHILKHLYIYCL